MTDFNYSFLLQSIKKMNKTLIFFLLICIYSCSNENTVEYSNKIIGTQVTESQEPDNPSKEQRVAERRKWVRVEERTDSLKSEKILEQVIIDVKPFLENANYTAEYEIFLDSFYGEKIRVEIDTFFSATQKHLIVNRNSYRNMRINIFSINESEITQVLRHTEWEMTYISDTIRDINGDQINDFVVNWYGSSGCCLKAFSDVYLSQPSTNIFLDSYEFINPTFSPREKVIRGVCYGHPGETEMYKFKWNKGKIDTLEYIYFELDEKGKKTGKFARSKNRSNYEKASIFEIVDKVPSEYEDIMGFNWFMDTL